MVTVSTQTDADINCLAEILDGKMTSPVGEVDEVVNVLGVYYNSQVVSELYCFNSVLYWTLCCSERQCMLTKN